MGKSRVFFRVGALEHVEALRLKERAALAVILQTSGLGGVKVPYGVEEDFIKGAFFEGTRTNRTGAAGDFHAEWWPNHKKRACLGARLNIYLLFLNHTCFVMSIQEL